MQQFDIRAVRREDIELIQTMYEHDIWMQYEMVDRHKGIATESSFSLAMYRWVNTIIEFISVVEQMDKIGINEIDAKIEKLAFAHTGIHHVQDETTITVYTHQNHYANDLSEIPASHLDMKDLDKEVDTDTHAMYWSLLEGVAWLMQTRADICPFVGYLQRAAQKPLTRHVRLLNRVL